MGASSLSPKSSSLFRALLVLGYGLPFLFLPTAFWCFLYTLCVPSAPFLVLFNVFAIYLSKKKLSMYNIMSDMTCQHA